MLDMSTATTDSDNESVTSALSLNSKQSKSGARQEPTTLMPIKTDLGQDGAAEAVPVASSTTVDVIGSVFKKNCAVKLKRLDFGSVSQVLKKSNYQPSSPVLELPEQDIAQDDQISIEPQSDLLDPPLLENATAVPNNIEKVNDVLKVDDIERVDYWSSSSTGNVASPHDSAPVLSDQPILTQLPTSITVDTDDNDVLTLSSATEDSADESDVPTISVRECYVKLEELDYSTLPDDVTIGIDTALRLTQSDSERNSELSVTESQTSDLDFTYDEFPAGFLCEEKVRPRIELYEVSELVYAPLKLSPHVTRIDICCEYAEYQPSPHVLLESFDGANEIPYCPSNKDIFVSQTSSQAIPNVSLPIPDLDIDVLPTVGASPTKELSDEVETNDMLCSGELNTSESSSAKTKSGSGEMVTNILYSIAKKSSESAETESRQAHDAALPSTQSGPKSSTQSAIGKLKLKKYSSAFRSTLKLAIENARDKEHHTAVNSAIDIDASETIETLETPAAQTSANGAPITNNIGSETQPSTKETENLKELRVVLSIIPDEVLSKVLIQGQNQKLCETSESKSSADYDVILSYPNTDDDVDTTLGADDSDYAPSLDEPNTDDDDEYNPMKKSAKPRPACAKARLLNRAKTLIKKRAIPRLTKVIEKPGPVMPSQPIPVCPPKVVILQPVVKVTESDIQKAPIEPYVSIAPKVIAQGKPGVTISPKGHGVSITQKEPSVSIAPISIAPRVQYVHIGSYNNLEPSKHSTKSSASVELMSPAEPSSPSHHKLVVQSSNITSTHLSADDLLAPLDLSLPSVTIKTPSLSKHQVAQHDKTIEGKRSSIVSGSEKSSVFPCKTVQSLPSTSVQSQLPIDALSGAISKPKITISASADNKDKALAYQKLIENIQKRLDDVNSQIKPTLDVPANSLLHSLVTRAETECSGIKQKITPSKKTKAGKKDKVTKATKHPKKTEASHTAATKNPPAPATEHLRQATEPPTQATEPLTQATDAGNGQHNPPSVLPSVPTVTEYGDSPQPIPQTVIEASEDYDSNFTLCLPMPDKDVAPEPSDERSVYGPVPLEYEPAPLDEVLEVIGADIADYQSGQSQSHNTSHDMGMSTGSDYRCGSPLLLADPPRLIQLDGSPESSSTENENSVGRPVRRPRTPGNKRRSKVPTSGLGASNNSSHAGESNSDGEFIKRTGAKEKKSKHSKKSKSAKSHRRSEKKKQTFMKRLAVSLCSLPYGTHTMDSLDDPSYKVYPNLTEEQVLDIQEKDRLEVCKHLMVDLKDRVICDVKHGDRCNPYCKDRMRVYKAHPDSKTDGFPTDNMKDDVTQVVYELLHDMKDRVVCDVSHFQLVCNKGRSCKISPRIHKFDTGMKIRVAPGLAMPKLSKLLTGATDVVPQDLLRLPTTKGYKIVDETKPKKSSKKCSKNKTSSDGGSQHTASDSIPDHLPSSVTHISASSLPTTLPQLPQPEAVTPESSTARPWVYYCRHCPETFSEEKAGGRHLREVHQAKGPLHVCNTCLHVSDSKAMHVIHQKYHSEPIVFRCKRCRYITPTRQTISTHIRYTQCREEDVELVSISSDGTEKLITTEHPKKSTKTKVTTKNKMAKALAGYTKKRQQQAAMLEVARQKSASDDVHWLTDSLLTDMVNRIECDTSHRTCSFRIGCRPGHNVYLSKKEIDGMKQDFMAADSDILLPTIGGLPPATDADEVISDLMSSMLNTVTCYVDHSSDHFSRHQCDPGVKCILYKKICKRPERLNILNVSDPKPQPEKKGKKPAMKVKKEKTVVTKPKLHLPKIVQRAPKEDKKVEMRRQKMRQLRERTVDTGWSDLDTDVEELAAAEDAADAEHDDEVSSEEEAQTDKQKITSIVKVTKKSKQPKEESDIVETIPTSDAPELPDLGVDVVLAVTSSDDYDDSTEPDSAGETTNRRKTSRRKKKLLPRDEREKLRQQMIEARRTTLKYMGTPRSMVLAQLIQEEATKQCAEILLPKNLPEYPPSEPVIRDFLFPSDLRLSSTDIADIITSIFPDGSGAQLISDMCEVQASGMVPDDKLLYQLCIFISTSTTDPTAVHNLIQVISKHSSTKEMCCPLPSCTSVAFDNWLQVGTHLLTHLPKVYLQLMSQAFRCPICWKGFPTPYHHRHHHSTEHEAIPFSAPLLMGFSGMELLNFWSTPEFQTMTLSNWALDKKRVPVDDFSNLIHGDPMPAIPPPEFVCCRGTETWCEYVGYPATTEQLEHHPSHLLEPSATTPNATGVVSSDTHVGNTERLSHDEAADHHTVTEVSNSDVHMVTEVKNEVMFGEQTADSGIKIEVTGDVQSGDCDAKPSGVQTASGDDKMETTEVTTGDDLYDREEISCVHVDEGVEQTVSIEEDSDITPENGAAALTSDSTEDAADGGTLLEEAADLMADQLVEGLTPQALPPVNMPAYICWFCARPFFGSGSFYLHLLQEAMALPAGGVLSGLEFSDVYQMVDCQACESQIPILELQNHLADHHSYINKKNDEMAYTKGSKQCPCVPCTEVFTKWAELGDHIAHTHTPSALRSNLQHQCTACERVFKTYYHARAHWEEKYESCGNESKATAVESFVGHNLPQNYFSEDMICKHDITFTKHRKYTFCSTYKTSSHVMCFVCQRIFHEDADDLDIDTMNDTLDRLQDRLSEHMKATHGVELHTGVTVSETVDLVSNADAETDVESQLSDSFSAEKEMAVSNQLSIRVEPLSVSQSKAKSQHNKQRDIALYSKVKQKEITPQQIMGLLAEDDEDVPKCRFHHVPYSKNARTSAQYCGQCKNVERSPTRDAASTFHILNGPLTCQPIKYCAVHDHSVLCVCETNTNYSYCSDCVAALDRHFTYAKSECKNHGPHYEDNCPRCSEKAEPVDNKTSAINIGQYTPKQTTERCYIHKESYVYQCYTFDLEPIKVCRSCRKTGIRNRRDKQTWPKVVMTCDQHPEAAVRKVNSGDKVLYFCDKCAMTTLKNDIICRFHPTKSLRLSGAPNNYVLGCTQCRYLYTMRARSRMRETTKKATVANSCLIHPKSTMTTCFIHNSEYNFTYCDTCAADITPGALRLAEREMANAATLDKASKPSRNIPTPPTTGRLASASASQSSTDSSANQLLRYTACDAAGFILVRYVGDDSALQMIDSADELSLLPQSKSASKSASGAAVNKEQNDSDLSSEESIPVKSAKKTPGVSNQASQYTREWKPQGHSLKCKYCDEMHTSLETYRSHYKMSHPDKKCRLPYPCRKCYFVSLDPRSIQQHYLTHSHPEAQSCTLCCALFLYKGVLSSHMKKVHQGSKQKAAAPELPKTPELDEHGWSSGHLFVCQYCCSHVNSYGAFCEHMTSVHNARRVPSLYPCSTCNYVTDAQPDLERHSQIHNAPTSYKCPSESCFYIASEPEAITNHLKLECKTTNSQGTVQMMMCEACDFIAWDEKTFKEHCAQHVKAESPPPSNQVLPKKKKVKKSDDMQAKTGWKAGHVFYCQASKHCKHRSNSQAEYKSHMKLKHKSPHVRTLIPCMRCNYVAELTVMATRHRALHMRSNAHSCDGCHFLSDSKKGHLDHLNLCKANQDKLPKHSRFYCLHCPHMLLTSRSAAVTHMERKHSDIMAKNSASLELHPCGRCPYVAVAKPLLAVHDDLHKAEHSYQCPRCFLLVDSLAKVKLHVKLTQCKSVEFVQRSPTDDVVVAPPEIIFYKDQLPKRHKYYCLKCPATISSVNEYNSHMMNKHGASVEVKTLVACNLCRYVGIAGQRLRFHGSLHSKSTVFQCKRCDCLALNQWGCQIHTQRSQCSISDMIEVSKKTNSGHEGAGIREKTTSQDTQPVSVAVYNNDDMGELSSSIDEYETDGDRDTEVSENKSERNTPTQGKRRVSLANKNAPDRLPKGYSHRCRHCKEKFISRKKFRVHCKGHLEKHSAIHFCRECYYTTNKIIELENHTALHKERNVFRCKNCCYLTKNKCFILRHAKLSPGCKVSDIKELAQLSKSKRLLNSRPEVDQESSIQRPSKIKKDSQKSSRYLRQSTQQKQIKIKRDIQKSGQNEARNPVKGDLPNGNTYFCRSCPASFRNTKDASRHRTTEHGFRGQLLYACDRCPYVALSLKLHAREHDAQKTYQCRRCYYLCGTKSDVKLHVLRTWCSQQDVIQINKKISNAEHVTIERTHETADVTVHSSDSDTVASESADSKTERKGDDVVTKKPSFARASRSKTEELKKCVVKNDDLSDESDHDSVNDSVKQKILPHGGGDFPEGSRYYCQKCDDSFSNATEARNHLWGVHGMISAKTGSTVFYPCGRCPYVATGLATIVSHVALHSAEVYLKCNRCSFLSATKGRAMGKHTNTTQCTKESTTEVHQGKTEELMKCVQKNDDLSDESDHDSVNDSVEQRILPHGTTEGLTECVEENDDLSDESNDDSVNNSVEHRGRSNGGGDFPEGSRYFCRKCDDSFSNATEARNHLWGVHGMISAKTGSAKFYPCGRCPYVATYEPTIVSHVALHSAEVYLKCNRCYFLSATNGRAMVKHTNATQCTMESTTEVHQDKKYDSHMDTHSEKHRMNGYTCGICPFATYKARSLKRHVALHQSLFVIQCNTCYFLADKWKDIKSHTSRYPECTVQNCTQILNEKAVEVTSDIDIEEIGDLYGDQEETTYSNPESLDPPEGIDVKWDLSERTESSVDIPLPHDPSRAISGILPSGYMFHCHHCPESFTDAKTAGDHMETTHGTSTSLRLYACDLCHHVTDNLREMTRHRQKHTEHTVYRCSRCLFITPYQRLADKHVEDGQCSSEHISKVEQNSQSITSEDWKESGDVESVTGQEEILKEEQHHSSRMSMAAKSAESHAEASYDLPVGYQYYCQYCPVTSTSTSQAFQHFKKSHSEKTQTNFSLVACDQCLYVAASHIDYEMHQRKHKSSSENMYRCTRCWYLAKGKARMARHVTNSQCSSSDIAATLKAEQSKPEKYEKLDDNEPAHHAGDKVCTVSAEKTTTELSVTDMSSDNTSSNQTNVDTSVSASESNKQGDSLPDGYVAWCPCCPQSFTSRQKYRDHMDTHSDNRRCLHICDLCPYVTYKSTLLHSHKAKHNLPFAIHCKRCHTLSTGWQGMRIHMTCNYTGCTEQDATEIGRKEEAEQSKPEKNLDDDKSAHHAADKVCTVTVSAEKTTTELPAADIASDNTSSNQTNVDTSVSASKSTAQGDSLPDGCVALCPRCPQSFTSRQKYRDHMDTHSDKRKTIFICDFCRYVTIKSELIHRHLAHHKLPYAIRCNRCHILTKSWTGMNIHMSRNRTGCTARDAIEIGRKEEAEQRKPEKKPDDDKSAQNGGDKVCTVTAEKTTTSLSATDMSTDSTSTSSKQTKTDTSVSASKSNKQEQPSKKQQRSPADTKKPSTEGSVASGSLIDPTGLDEIEDSSSTWEEGSSTDKVRRVSGRLKSKQPIHNTQTADNVESDNTAADIDGMGPPSESGSCKSSSPGRLRRASGRFKSQHQTDPQSPAVTPTILKVKQEIESSDSSPKRVGKKRTAVSETKSDTGDQHSEAGSTNSSRSSHDKKVGKKRAAPSADGGAKIKKAKPATEVKPTEKTATQDAEQTERKMKAQKAKETRMMQHFFSDSDDENRADNMQDVEAEKKDIIDCSELMIMSMCERNRQITAKKNRLSTASYFHKFRNTAHISYQAKMQSQPTMVKTVTMVPRGEHMIPMATGDDAMEAVLIDMGIRSHTPPEIMLLATPDLTLHDSDMEIQHETEATTYQQKQDGSPANDVRNDECSDPTPVPPSTHSEVRDKKNIVERRSSSRSSARKESVSPPKTKPGHTEAGVLTSEASPASHKTDTKSPKRLKKSKDGSRNEKSPKSKEKQSPSARQSKSNTRSQSITQKPAELPIENDSLQPAPNHVTSMDSSAVSPPSETSQKTADQKTKHKINLSEYRQRTKHVGTPSKLSASGELEQQTVPTSNDPFIPEGSDMEEHKKVWEGLGVYGVTTKYSPHRWHHQMTMKQRYLHTEEEYDDQDNISQFPSVEPRLIDFIYTKPARTPCSVTRLNTSSLTSPQLSEAECAFDTASVDCRHCARAIRGMENILAHCSEHEERRCFRCNRLFPDEHHLHSHIACVHLNMSYASFERWREAARLGLASGSQNNSAQTIVFSSYQPVITSDMLEYNASRNTTLSAGHSTAPKLTGQVAKETESVSPQKMDSVKKTVKSTVDTKTIKHSAVKPTSDLRARNPGRKVSPKPVPPPDHSNALSTDNKTQCNNDSISPKRHQLRTSELSAILKQQHTHDDDRMEQRSLYAGNNTSHYMPSFTEDSDRIASDQAPSQGSQLYDQRSTITYPAPQTHTYTRAGALPPSPVYPVKYGVKSYSHRKSATAVLEYNPTPTNLEYHPTPVSQVKPKPQPYEPEPYVPEPYIPSMIGSAVYKPEPYEPLPITKDISPTDKMEKSTREIKPRTRKSNIKSPIKEPINIPLHDTYATSSTQSPATDGQTRKKDGDRLTAADDASKIQSTTAMLGTELCSRPLSRPSSSRSSVPDWVVVDELGDEDYRRKPDQRRSSSRTSSMRSPEPAAPPSVHRIQTETERTTRQPDVPSPSKIHHEKITREAVNQGERSSQDHKSDSRGPSRRDRDDRQSRSPYRRRTRSRDRGAKPSGDTRRSRGHRSGEYRSGEYSSGSRSPDKRRTESHSSAETNRRSSQTERQGAGRDYNKRESRSETSREEARNKEKTRLENTYNKPEKSERDRSLRSDKVTHSDRYDTSPAKSSKRSSVSGDRSPDRKRRRSDRHHESGSGEKVLTLTTHDGHIVRVKPDKGGKFELA